MNIVRSKDSLFARRLLAPIACASVGIVSVFALEVSPVGRLAPDLAWTALLGTVAGIAIPRASLRLVTVIALVSLGFASGPISLGSAFVALVVALTLAVHSGWQASTNDASSSPAAFLAPSAIGAPLFFATLSFQDHGVQFLSAGVASMIWIAFVIAMFFGLDSRDRTRVAVIGTAIAFAGLAILAGAAIQLRQSYEASTVAQAHLTNGLRMAREGNIADARESLSLASTRTNAAIEPFSSVFVRALRQVPVAGQNLEAAQTVLVPADGVIQTAHQTLQRTPELDALVDTEGVALGEVQALALGVDRLLAAAMELQTALTSERSDWVVAPIDQRLRTVADRTAAVEQLSQVSLASSIDRILGSAEPRSYLVLFGNTAEARELGGFAGGTALITVEDGSISLERADRPTVLNDTATTPTVLTQPSTQRFLEHQPWLYSQNYTALADFPTLAPLLADLYPNMGGAEIDGVIYFDVQALAALLGIAGDLHLPVADIDVTADNVVDLVHIGQYELFPVRSDREAFLSELIAATFENLTTIDATPSGDSLTPLLRAVQQDRLLFVPFDEEEFAVVEALGMVGELADRDGDDFLAVSHLNGGPNKLDTYLDRSVEYVVNVDPVTGALDASLEVTLTNSAPAGLPSYVAGNRNGYPDGTNRAVVVIHTPHEATNWQGGDEPELHRRWQEFGLHRYEQVVAIPRGESRVVSVQLTGSVNPGRYELEIGHQPLVRNDEFSLSLTPTTGTFETNDRRLMALNETVQGTFALTHDTQITPTLIPDE